MSITSPQDATFRTADLSARKPTRFALEPDTTARNDIARDLGLEKLPKLRLSGEIRPDSGSGWQLIADLGATVVQACIVTLDPVTTRIDETVRRHFVPEDQMPELGEESESPEDDSLEPLGPTIPVWEAMVEALSLALPPYPRKDDAALSQTAFAEDGVTPLQDADLKPFAGLAALRDKMTGGDNDDET